MILAKSVPVALAEAPMSINQCMKAIVPSPKLRSCFLPIVLEVLPDNLFKKAWRLGHATLSLMGHEVASFKILLSHLLSKEEILSAVQNSEHKNELHERKQIQLQLQLQFQLQLQLQLQDLFRTLLHELVSAKSRVPAHTWIAD